MQQVTFFSLIDILILFPYSEIMVVEGNNYICSAAKGNEFQNWYDYGVIEEVTDDKHYYQQLI